MEFKTWCCVWTCRNSLHSSSSLQTNKVPKNKRKKPLKHLKFPAERLLSDMLTCCSALCGFTKRKTTGSNDTYKTRGVHINRQRAATRLGALEHLLPVGLVLDVLTPVAHSFCWLQTRKTNIHFIHFSFQRLLCVFSHAMRHFAKRRNNKSDLRSGALILRLLLYYDHKKKSKVSRWTEYYGLPQWLEFALRHGKPFVPCRVFLMWIQGLRVEAVICCTALWRKFVVSC